MTREELLELHKSVCADAISIMRAKNEDYSGGSGDPFANFRASDVFGVKPETGILLRTMDKLKRIQAFIEKGELSVKTEPVDDAIRDVINYMVLLKGMIKERENDCGAECCSSCDCVHWNVLDCVASCEAGCSGAMKLQR